MEMTVFIILFSMYIEVRNVTCLVRKMNIISTLSILHQFEVKVCRDLFILLHLWVHRDSTEGSKLCYLYKQQDGSKQPNKTLTICVCCTCCYHSFTNSPFPSCFEPHHETRLSAFRVKISFVCIIVKINFCNKSYAGSLAFMMRFKATRK